MEAPWDKSSGKRCLGAGIWASIVFWAASGIEPETLRFAVVFPSIGLPWLFLAIHDSHQEREPLSVGDALLSWFGGSIISMFCSLPFILAVAIFKWLFP